MTPVRRLSIDLEAPGEPVPAMLLLPSPSGPMPAALLLHGLSSTKERMSDSIGRALADRGIASLSIDLPLHGVRDGDLSDLTPRQPLAIVRHWKQALTDVDAAVDFLVSRPDIDATRITLVGYSLGAFLGVHVAATDRRISHVVLAAGGDLPDNLPFAALVRTIADPVRAARRMTQPILMINGRLDRTVTAAQAQRLYEAAPQPKELRWYQGGHWPPTGELNAAADWIRDRSLASSATGLQGSG
jgi:dienelactone hydrolase